MCRSDPQTLAAGIVRDVGPHERKVILGASSQSPTRPLQGVFRSRWNSRIECSADLPTLASESTGRHEPVVRGSLVSCGIIRTYTVTVSLTYIDVELRICRLDLSASFEI